MTTAEFRSCVKELHRLACAGEAVEEFTKLMNRRKEDRCCQRLGCGKRLPRRCKFYCSVACYMRDFHTAPRSVITGLFIMVAASALSQPPMPQPSRSQFPPRIVSGPKIEVWHDPVLTWTYVETPVLGYKVWWGKAGDDGFTNVVDVGMTNEYAVGGLEQTAQYQFAVTAYSARGESSFSNIVLWGPPAVPETRIWIEVGVVLEFSEHASGPWLTGSNAIYLVGPRMKQPKEQGFWRARPTIRQEYK